MAETIVSVQNVKKSYKLGRKDVQALAGVTLEIQAREFVALAGSSGSGKTTLLNLIGCLDMPSSGAISVFGLDTQQARDVELSRLRGSRLGFIFQNFNLIPVLSALENVEYGLLHLASSRKERRERAEAALVKVGLRERVEHRPDELSGGQRQRVAIARAIVHSPQLIVADEPTAALDKKTAAEILDLLQRLQTEMNVAVVLASHDPLALSRAARVVQLSDGLIVDSAPGDRR